MRRSRFGAARKKSVMTGPRTLRDHEIFLYYSPPPAILSVSGQRDNNIPLVFFPYYPAVQAQAIFASLLRSEIVPIDAVPIVREKCWEMEDDTSVGNGVGDAALAFSFAVCQDGAHVCEAAWPWRQETVKLELLDVCPRGRSTPEKLVGWICPSEDRLVLIIVLLNERFLQPDERSWPLAIIGRHPDSKEAKKGISRILDFAGSPVGHPAHLNGNASLLVPSIIQIPPIDLCGGFDFKAQILPSIDKVPVVIEELHVRRRQEFLQRPTAIEPTAPPKTPQFPVQRCPNGLPLLLVMLSFIVRHILEISITDFRTTIPLCHEAKRLTFFALFAFIDAAAINPERFVRSPFQIVASLVASPSYFPPAGILGNLVMIGVQQMLPWNFALPSIDMMLSALSIRSGFLVRLLIVREQDFVVGPHVGEDGVFWFQIGAAILFHLQSVHIDQPHG